MVYRKDDRFMDVYRKAKGIYDEIVQTKAFLESNLKKAETFIIEAVKRGSNIICFPEMWTTGFNWTNNEKIAKDQNKTIEKISQLAKQNKIWINGSVLALNEKGKVANTSLLFNADGKIVGTYRKTHLFTLLKEDKHMAPGESLCAVKAPWGSTGLSICYDVRFPEMFRTYALNGVQIVLMPMAFPYPRLAHLRTLIRARAIENQMFMVGINQVGEEDYGADGKVTYFGSSCIIDPWGETVVEASQDKEELLTATIDTSMSDEIRNKMHVLKDRRPDLYFK